MEFFLVIREGVFFLKEKAFTRSEIRGVVWKLSGLELFISGVFGELRGEGHGGLKQGKFEDDFIEVAAVLS